MAERDRSEWVDIAKGVTIILMVYGHVTKGLVNSGLLELTPFMSWLEDVLATFRMPLFFFLAGLFLVPCLRKYGAQDLVRRRIDTLVYPYILWTLVHSGVKSLVPDAANHDPLAWHEIFNFWIPQHHYWFVYTLFFLTMTGIALFTLVPRHRYLVALAVGFGVYLGRPWLPHFHPTIYMYGTLCFFLLGAALQPHMGGLRGNASRLWQVGAVVFLAATLVFLPAADLDYTVHGWPALLVGLIAIPTVIALCMRIADSRAGHVLARFGAASLPIYLAHVIFAAGCRTVLRKLGIADPSVQLAAGLLAGTIGPMLLYLAAPRIGLMWLFQPPRLLSAARPVPQSRPRWIGGATTARRSSLDS